MAAMRRTSLSRSLIKIVGRLLERVGASNGALSSSCEEDDSKNTSEKLSNYS
jgi:hypothetical protein